MSTLDTDESFDYLVNTKREMNGVGSEDGHPMFQGTHNDYLEKKEEKSSTSADRFVSMFFWVAVLAAVLLVSLVIASLVLQSRQNRLVPITSFPESFRMSDGTVLNGIVTRPLNVKVARPVVLSLTSKRLGDAHAASSWRVASELAARGLIVVQVENYGSGSNDGPRSTYPFGLMDINYGVELVTQCAKSVQGSNGNVGILGLGVDATLALLIAQRSPEKLGTVVALHPADDWFWIDAFQDGNFQPDLYQSMAEQLATLPKSPMYRLDEDYIASRYNISLHQPNVFTLLEHQTHDNFWNTFSVDPSAFKVPVYLIGGIYNTHKDSTLNLYSALMANPNVAKVKVVLGPYGFQWPEEGPYGAKFNSRADVANWFKQWLSDDDDGFLREPDVSMFYRQYFAPGPSETTAPPPGMTGYWRYEGWPIQRTQDQTYSGIGAKKVVPADSSSFELGSAWGPLTGNTTALDTDSATIDLQSAIHADTWLNGFVYFSLNVSASVSSLVNWNVRLEDVSPNGDVSLVTGCSLNEAMSRANPNISLPKSGTWHQLEGKMHYTTWMFPSGHTIRVAITNSASGMQWSSSPGVAASVNFHSSSFSIPTVQPRTGLLGRTPKFTAVAPTKPFDDPTGFPYNRTFAVNSVVPGASADASSWVTSQGTYSNANDVLFVGFVGQNITTANQGRLMEHSSLATHIIVTGVSNGTPDDPPGIGTLYLHDLLDQIQTQFSFGVNGQGVSTNRATGAERIPNLSMDRYRWVQVTTTTHLTSDDSNFYVTSTRAAKSGTVTLPTQTESRTFARSGH